VNYFFLDASALVKRYHQESGSDVVNRLLDELLASSPERVAISPLGLLVASDRRFLRAAEAEGLAVINPETADMAEAVTFLSVGEESD